VPSTKELGVNATIDNWRVMIGARGITPPQTAYWENVLARVVATDEWKAMLEKIRSPGNSCAAAKRARNFRQNTQNSKML
jgi:tripartite-type tricarboxylate transporter receptor subunit TctC